MARKKHETKVGQRYGSLLVTSEPFHRWSEAEGQNKRYVTCECDCGDIRAYHLNNVTSGYSTRCKKCANRRVAEANRTHGMYATRTYKIWGNLRHRRWGAVPQWADFDAFLKDIGGPIPDGQFLNVLDARKPIGPGNYELSSRRENHSKKYAERLSGIPATKVAKLLGVSRQRVFQLLKRYGDLKTILESRGML